MLSNSSFLLLFKIANVINVNLCSPQEAEAILEDISPSPVQVLGYGVVRLRFL